jgi:hypothetical protein
MTNGATRRPWVVTLTSVTAILWLATTVMSIHSGLVHGQWPWGWLAIGVMSIAVAVSSLRSELRRPKA